MIRKFVPILLVLVLVLPGLAACGSSDNEKSSSKAPTGSKPGAPVTGKKGGDLTVLYAADVDSIDPSITYYQYGFNVVYSTQRPLYSYKPTATTEQTADLADGKPDISSDAKTVTVKIKSGIKYSPPLQDQTVKSADVKYAIERGFKSNIPNGYNGAYMGNLEGLAAYKSKKAKDISGITTPDEQTIVFKLSKPTGAILAAALVLPGSAPVPKDYAAKFDAKNPSQYGEHQVFTGPYMVKNDASGKLVGYKPGREIDLVRNPSWDKSTDYRPAYLDSITIKEGNGDAVVASRRILGSQSTVNGDFQVPPNVLKQVTQGSQKSQLIVTPPTGRVRYVSMDTTRPPFNDENVRKAVSAGLNRQAMRLAFGGELVGDIPTHFIPPGISGYEQAGGAKGPGDDFLAKPEGDMAVAQAYMKKAGYASGKYDKGGEFVMVADNATNQKRAAQVAQQAFEAMGFKINLISVVRDTMYTKYCSVPKSKADICPSVGWLKDFADPQTLLDPTFNGKNILPAGNSNWPEFNDKTINAAMDKAEVISAPSDRAQAWGAIDKQLTDKAAAVPWLWDRQPNVLSKNVNGVINLANATWDFSFTSLK